MENNGLRFLKKTLAFPNSKEKVTIIFFWSSFLNEQSKKAFKTVIDNINMYAEGDLPMVITVNTDHTYGMKEF